MADVLRQAATAEPIHRTEAKEHLRVDGTDEDTLIDVLISTARQKVESYTRRVLVRQERELKLDGFPGVITLPRSPLRAVTSIKYLDTNGTETTLASTEYRVDADSECPRIVPAYGKTWPSTRGVINDVTVRYRAGYAMPITDADNGTDIITAAGHDLANNDIVQLYNSAGALPGPLTKATNYYVVNATTDTLQLSTSEGGSAVDVVDGGTGANFIGVVPEEIRNAMLLLIGHLYENRQAITADDLAELPMGFYSLLSEFRVITF